MGADVPFYSEKSLSSKRFERIFDEIVELLLKAKQRGGWEWLKSYRAGDADRKEFLYPENWLEPES